MDSRISQTNPEKIGLYDFSERKNVLALPNLGISLPHDKEEKTPERPKYEIEAARPRHPIHIYLPQSAKLLKKSVLVNVQYQAYHQAQMLEDQEARHFVDILV